jgi:serine/threonine-protein kinase
LGAEEAAAPEEPVVEILFPVDDSVKPERTDPQRIGRYELCFELASGGMASVYLARIDGVSGFEKLVALKRIHPHLAKEKDYVDMFLDEARIASRITHANVCSVFDFGEVDGEHYIAMEYLVGEPLSRLMSRSARDKSQRRSRLLPLRMARIMADACEGLHAAHELKDANGDLLHVVHRDASPRNLFVTYDGAVQVVDFGIASAKQRLHHTATGKVKGTFAYMAPEQLTAHPIDRRVDIWALGVTLWEMLAVRRLFKRDTTASTVHSVLYDEIQPPSQHRPQIPEELDRIVLKALERDPTDRWQTAREMGKALRQFLGTQNEIMGPAELSEWMGEVFPQGEARKSQLMEIARMASTALPTMPQANDVEESLTATDVRLVGATEFPEPRSRRRKLLAASVLGALTVLVAIAFGSDESETQVAVDEAAEVEASTPPPRLEATLEAEPVAGEEVLDPSMAKTDDARTDKQTVEAMPQAQKRTRSQQRAKAQPGTINLVTRGGWAEIYEGKKSLGSTPRRLTLSSGRHKLLLKPFGTEKPKTVYVVVEANKTKKVSIALD